MNVHFLSHCGCTTFLELPKLLQLYYYFYLSKPLRLLACLLYFFYVGLFNICYSQKTEIVCCPDTDIKDSLLLSLPGAQAVDPTKATLLGSPIGDESSILDTLHDKTNLLKRMGIDSSFYLPMMPFSSSSTPSLCQNYCIASGLLHAFYPTGSRSMMNSSR